MGSLTELFEKHPVAVFVAIGVVVLLALRSGSSGTASSGGPSFVGGGEIAPPLDPNAAGVMTAQVNAASQEFNNLASLAAAEQQTSAQETLGLAQTSATVEANKLSAQLQSELAATQLQAEQSAIAAQEAIAANNNSTNRAIARAADNTSIAGGVIGVVGGLLKVFGL